MSLQENAMLGPYRIVRMLGEGGMGAVYRARDTRLGRDVAVKVLTSATLSDHERLARFEQEARATGLLNHPNLLTIFDIGHSEGTPFLVSELLEGETLRDRLARGPLPPRKAIDAASQMAQGLTAAHEKGIIHRDLKPENIFLTREGRVKILDFGIAKLSAKLGGDDDGPVFQMAATEPGMVLGTVGYMSPEQVRGEMIDARSDIFAFGAIFYEMLTGNRAFKRNSSIETLSAILKEEPQDLTELLPNVPPPVEKLVRRCLEKDRDHRFQTAQDLAFNLETLSSFSSPRTLSGTPLPSSIGSQSSSQQAPTAVTPRQSSPSLNTRTSATSAVRARTTTHIAQKPKRGISPVLLVLLYLASVAGAVWGTWRFAHRGADNVPEVSFQRMTFRRGDVRGARFSADGETIVYSAAWDGNPSQTFIATSQSPEARPLGVADSEVLAIAKSTELALLLRRDRQTNAGVLARIPLAGGTPREVADGIVDADWAPDGQNLAVIRAGAGNYRIEYPIGTVKYESAHALKQLRLSPDGKRIAFVEPETDAIDIAILDPNSAKPVTIARGFEHGVNGMAWAPGAKELWITGTSTAAPPSLYAVNVDTLEQRLVSRLTGSMKLYDLSSTGRALLSTGMWRASLAYQPPGETTERDASWLDWSMLADLSADGKTILFNETREGGGARSGVYLRQVNAMPVRIADGLGDAISPDGKWVLCHQGKKLVLVPTGTGEARDLKINGAFDLGAVWLPDSKRVVLAGVGEKDKAYRLHVIDTLDETDTPISENAWGDAQRPFAVSPDGRFVAGVTGQQTIAIYAIDGKTPLTPVPAAQPGEIPLQWSADGASLYVYRPTTLAADVVKITLATGAREPWKRFTPADPAGIYRLAPVCITPDGSAYAYNALRSTSDLYLGEGLR